MTFQENLRDVRRAVTERPQLRPGYQAQVSVILAVSDEITRDLLLALDEGYEPFEIMHAAANTLEELDQQQVSPGVYVVAGALLLQQALNEKIKKIEGEDHE